MCVTLINHTDVFGLLIDPFVTHNSLNQTIRAKSVFTFLINDVDMERRVGFQIQAYKSDTVKVQVKDSNENFVNATINYGVNGDYFFISSEFEPQIDGPYSVAITNNGEEPVKVTGTYGIMLSEKEVSEIFRKNPISIPYEPVPDLLLEGFIGGILAIAGTTIGYIIFRKRK